MSSNYTPTAIEPLSSSRKLREPLESSQVQIPFLPKLPQSIDSLTTSTKNSTPPITFERPRLAPPEAPVSRALSEYLYLDVMNKLKDRSNAITETISKRIDINKRQVQKLAEQNLEKIKDNAEKIESSAWWDMLKKAATALLSALSLGLGLSLIAGGGSAVAGGALIASGILSIANFTCAQAGVWDELAKQLAQNDEERRKKIGMIIPVAVGIISAGLGFFGGLHSMAFASTFLTSKILGVLQASLSTFQGVVAIGRGITRSNLVHSQAEMLETRVALDEERIHLQVMTQWIENFMSEMKGISEKVSLTAQMIIQANQNIVQA